MPRRTQMCMYAVCGVECTNVHCLFAHNWDEAEENFRAFCNSRDVATYVILAREHFEKSKVYGGRLSWDNKFVTITFPAYKAYVNHVLAPEWLEKFENGWAAKWAEHEMEIADAEDADEEAKKNMELFEALTNFFEDVKKELNRRDEECNEGAILDEEDEEQVEEEMVKNPTFLPMEAIEMVA